MEEVFKSLAYLFVGGLLGFITGMIQRKRDDAKLINKMEELSDTELLAQQLVLDSQNEIKRTMNFLKEVVKGEKR